MFAQQLHYTSCRFGQGNGPGFQIRARSEGMDDNDVATLVRMGLHVPPDYAGDHAQETRTVTCPPALRVFTLPSGKRAIQHSLYLGCDYSGREGNFFTHSLLFDQPQPGEHLPYPLDLHGWLGWCLNAEPDAAPPEPLPLANICAVTPCGNSASSNPFSFIGLARFLRASPVRLSRLERLVATVSLPQNVRKTMIIRDIASDLPYWIACIIRCLPHETAERLAYSTYQGEACCGLDIMGTVPGTALDHLPANTCTVFDFTQNIMPDVGLPLASVHMARQAIRKLLGQSLPLDALPAILAVSPFATGVELMRLVHAARTELALAPFGGLTVGPVPKNDKTCWHRPPLHNLGLAFAQHDVRRLHALLGILPPQESAAWLLACCETFRAAPCTGEALHALGTSHPAQAQRLRALLDKAHEHLCLASELRYLLTTCQDRHAAFQTYCTVNVIPHFYSRLLKQ